MSKPVLLIILVVLILVSGVYYSHVHLGQILSLNPTPPPVTQPFLYHNRFMGFSVLVPPNYHIKDQLIRVTITSLDGKVNVYIDRSGTNFDNLYDYLKDLDNHNPVKIITNQDLTINTYPANFRTIKFHSGETQVMYTIFIDGWVYTIYSNDDSTLPVLRQITQSFKYMP